MSLLDDLKAAREARCEAYAAFLTAKEDLRAAENLALDRRMKAGNLGTNAESRRVQIDGDCAAERGAMLTAEIDLVYTDTKLAVALDAISPYATL